MYNQTKENDDVIDIKKLISNLWRIFYKNLIVIVATTVLFSCLGGFIDYRSNKNKSVTYEASVTFLVHITSKDINGVEFYDVVQSKSIASTFAKLMYSDKMITKLIEVTATELSADELYEMIYATNEEYDEFFTVLLVGETPEEVMRLIGGYVAVAVDFCDEYYKESTNIIMSRSPVSIFSVDPEAEEVQPKMEYLKIFYGAVFGLFLSYGFFFILKFFDSVVDDSDSLESKFDAPIIKTAHDFTAKTNSQTALLKSADNTANSADYNSFLIKRKLSRENSPSKKDAHIVYAVTSGDNSFSKSVNCFDLANSIASFGNRVLIIEADYKQKNLTKSFNLEGVSGLMEFLSDGKTAPQIKQIDSHNVSVLPVGNAAKKPSAFLYCENFKTLIIEMKMQYDYIVIDLPVIGEDADVSAIPNALDGYIYAVENGSSKTSKIEKDAEIIKSVGEKIIGFVLNGAKCDEN